MKEEKNIERLQIAKKKVFITTTCIILFCTASLILAFGPFPWNKYMDLNYVTMAFVIVFSIVFIADVILICVFVGKAYILAKGEVIRVEEYFVNTHIREVIPKKICGNAITKLKEKGKFYAKEYREDDGTLTITFSYFGEEDETRITSISKKYFFDFYDIVGNPDDTSY